MSTNHVCSVKKNRLSVPSSKKAIVDLFKWSLLSLGVATIFFAMSAIVGATPGSWAQCGSDSSIECSGGVRCTETDQVGCACYDSAGRVVDKHSCKEAAPDDLPIDY
jgi:hypothetical protein